MRVSMNWHAIKELQNAVDNLDILRFVYGQKVDEKERG